MKTVPDNDVIPSRFPRHWRRAARLAVGAGSPTDVATGMTKAVAATLRETGGCPGLNAIADSVERCVRGMSAWAEEIQDLRELPYANAHTAIALDVARAFIATRPQGTGHDVRLQFTQTFLERILRRNLFARARSLLVTDRFGRFEVAQDFETKSLSAVPMDQLARRLLAHEDGRGLVAPPTVGSRLSTEALLHDPLPS